MLPVTSEMVDDEDNNTSGKVGEIKSLSTLECEGFSEVSNLSVFCSFISTIQSFHPFMFLPMNEI